MSRYTATTTDGARRTGSSYEIAAWLQEQDWGFGEAGAAGQLPWRRAVAGRITIQTGRTLDAGVVEAENPEAFLWALAAAGTLLLEELGSEELGSEELGSEELGSEELGSEELGSEEFGSEEFGEAESEDTHAND